MLIKMDASDKIVTQKSLLVHVWIIFNICCDNLVIKSLLTYILLVIFCIYSFIRGIFVLLTNSRLVPVFKNLCFVIVHHCSGACSGRHSHQHVPDWSFLHRNSGSCLLRVSMSESKHSNNWWPVTNYQSGLSQCSTMHFWHLQCVRIWQPMNYLHLGGLSMCYVIMMWIFFGR